MLAPLKGEMSHDGMLVLFRDVLFKFVLFRHSLPGAIAKRLDPRSASAEPMLETSFLYSSSSLGGSPTRSDGSPMPEEWMHGRLSPISQRMQGRGPPGLRRSLPAALTGPPLLNPITAHTPQIGYRAWRRHFQPGSGVGINHELLPIRPL